MPRTSFVRTAAVIAAFTTMILVGVTANSKRVSARDNDDSAESKIKRGFDIAPVPLDLHGKNPALVGLGSYIVNAVGDCNGCHSSGPQKEFKDGGNPYLRAPFFSGVKAINTATYLGGGRDFGPFGSLPHLYSRNLTPDKTGMPAGGMTYDKFVEVLRKGTDFDHVHPNCITPGNPTNCLMPPFNGDLLQVMRWPFFQNMTDRDIRAIYEYLSAIPCNPGQVIAGAPYLQNECP